MLNAFNRLYDRMTVKYGHFTMLLSVLLLMLLLAPLLTLFHWPNFLLRLAFILFIASSMATFYRNSKQYVFTVILGLLTLIINLIAYPYPDSLIEVFSIGGNLVFMAYILVQIMKIVLLKHREEVTLDVINGAISIYILLSVTWAMLYRGVDLLIPGSLAFSTHPEKPVLWGHYIYFSLTTLTTLGYGDLVPQHLLIQTLAVMEACSGVLFVAILMARLVSLYQPQRKK